MLFLSCVFSIVSKRFMINSKKLFFQKIRAVPFRLVSRSFLTPTLDLSMMAGQQNFRHPHAFEVRRPRVMRIVEQAFRERLSSSRRFASQRAGYQSNDSINNDQRSRLAA